MIESNSCEKNILIPLSVFYAINFWSIAIIIIPDELYYDHVVLATFEWFKYVIISIIIALIIILLCFNIPENAIICEYILNIYSQIGRTILI